MASLESTSYPQPPSAIRTYNHQSDALFISPSSSFYLIFQIHCVLFFYNQLRPASFCQFPLTEKKYCQYEKPFLSPCPKTVYTNIIIIAKVADEQRVWSLYWRPQLYTLKVYFSIYFNEFSEAGHISFERALKPVVLLVPALIICPQWSHAPSRVRKPLESCL